MADREVLERRETFAAIKAAWEAFNGVTAKEGHGDPETLYRRVIHACRAYASALGASPAPEPSGDGYRFLKKTVLNALGVTDPWAITGWTPKMIEERITVLCGVRPISGEPPEVAQLRGELEACEQHVKILESQRVPPAVPTAATPDPKSETNLRVIVDQYVPKWEQPAIYAAIWDWHRRAIRGEPDVEPTKVVRAMAYETDEDFGYDRIKADEYSMGRGNIPALILLFADKETRDRAARLRSQHPEGPTT